MKTLRCAGIPGLAIFFYCLGVWSAAGVPADGLVLFRVPVDPAIGTIVGGISGLLALAWLVVEGAVNGMFG